MTALNSITFNCNDCNAEGICVAEHDGKKDSDIAPFISHLGYDSKDSEQHYLFGLTESRVTLTGERYPYVFIYEVKQDGEHG